MSTTIESLADTVADLAAQLEAITEAAGEDTVLGLEVRVDALQAEVLRIAGQVATLAEGVAAGGQRAGSEAGGEYQFESLAEWVDVVFTRLAARHRGRWCTTWTEHLDAVFRLESLWHTWESANAHGSTDHGARDEWTRVIFDHHVAWLLDPHEGPFAGCHDDLCTPAPRLTQRRIAPTGVIDLEARRRQGYARIAGEP